MNPSVNLLDMTPPWWLRLWRRLADWATSPPSWRWDGEEQRYRPVVTRPPGSGSAYR